MEADRESREAADRDRADCSSDWLWCRLAVNCSCRSTAEAEEEEATEAEADCGGAEEANSSLLTLRERAAS